MPILAGGDVVPSILSVNPGRTAIDFLDSNSFSNNSLRLGEVIEILYPDDIRSRSKVLIEYRVMVQESDGYAGAARVYENCLLMNTFGGIADYSNWTLRVDKEENRDKYGLAKGSKVLILCVNGETNTSFIVAGVRDETDTRDKDTVKDLGHHGVWEFNGVNVTVNKDGEFQILYKGKTDIDGKVNSDVESAKANSLASFTKDGNVNVTTPQKMIIKPDKGLEIGAATDKMLLASTYRDQEHQLNNTIQQQMSTLQQQLLIAAASITSASAVPSVPGAPLAILSVAGTALIQAAVAASQISAALIQFEAMKDQFLSKNNKND